MSQDMDYGNIIPHSLRPICRAYALGHLTTTAPRLFGFIRVITRRKDLALGDKLSLLKHILRSSTQLNRFPTACAIIVGGATALPRLIKTILQWLLNTLNNANGTNSTGLSSKVTSRLRYLCSFLSAWLAFTLLNRDEEWSRKRAMSISKSRSSLLTATNTNPDISNITSQEEPQPQSELSSLALPVHHPPPIPMKYAGKTTDFTLFALTRALTTLVSTLYTSTLSSPYHPSKSHPRLTSVTTTLTSPLIFSLSATIIMSSWFYSPERLPRSYNTWISSAANIHPSLIQALRLARQGDFIYGQDTGQGKLLADLCHEIGHPSSYGDPNITAPIPCELYHSGTGPSCELHALTRWIRGWIFAMKLYLPLQLITRARRLLQLLRSSLSSIITRNKDDTSQAPINTLLKTLYKILKSAATSSSFLATFIALFYYSVCLARTRLGPKIFPSVSRQAWDSGLCVLAGCLTCGWSILLQDEAKRFEIAQFVAPRAMATMLPRVYDVKDRWKEHVVFAGSVAVVMGAVVDGNKDQVRGLLGRVLASVAREY